MAIVKALVIGGGGGGGGSVNGGGGGGAGGFLFSSGLTVNYGTYGITVGGGGAALSKGTNSVFSSITAEGGGAGIDIVNGGNGGSGGGGGTNTGNKGGSASAGNIGGNGGKGGGGGGGAGAAGSNAYPTYNGGAGGTGLVNPIVGSTSGQNVTGTYYLAGGGGGVGASSGGAGGIGGGGAGVKGLNGTNGTVNTGGGGGASKNAVASLGGSGIVIISWITADFGTCSVTGTGNTITTSGENSIATFTSSGNILFTPIGYDGPSNFGLYNKRPSTITKGYYNFNNDSLDTSGNNMNGTDTSMSYVNGKYNLCASFNGSNGRIQLPDAAGINTTFTFNAFIKLNGTNNNTIYSKGSDASNGWGCLFTISTTLFESAVVTTTPTTAQQTLSQVININTNVYYMVTLVFDNSARTLKGYINGNLLKTISTGANLRGTNNVYIGVNKGGPSFSNYFNGSMDELVIENRVWTDDEIRKFYTYSRGNFGII